MGVSRADRAVQELPSGTPPEAREGIRQTVGQHGVDLDLLLHPRAPR